MSQSEKIPARGALEVSPWTSIGDADRLAWNRLRVARSSLDSPFFSLGWFDAVDRARGDLLVARWSRAGEAAAFLPLHRGRLRLVTPGGGPLSDAHGLVGDPPTETRFEDLMASLDASGFRYTGAPSDDPLLGSLPGAPATQHSIRLTDGYDAYVRDQREKHPKAFRNLRARRRRLDGARLEIRFDDRDGEALDQIFALKRAQYRRTAQIDVFGFPWTRRLIHDLFARPPGETRCLLSTLRIDGELAAGHFGLEAEGVLHWWFPAYAERFAHLSPGLLLLHEVAQQGAGLGLRRIDLGGGDYRFKTEFANGGDILLSGRWHAARGVGPAIEAADRLADRWSRLPLGPAASLPLRALRRIEREVDFRAAGSRS
ncbi:MAG: GNAT family N-acetyltransferase [Pseudomonadota bacterium]